VVNALTDYLPYFLALSASSPYWHGRDTGMASARTKIFEGLPTAGLPPSLDGWAAFEDLMDTFVSAGAISTVREIWWDIRPHPDFGTVELRMCDAMPTMTEITAVAALAQSLVEWFDGLIERGYSLPRPHDWLVRHNKWLAARFGLDAELILDHRGTRRPVREALTDLVAELAPTARRLNCAEELDQIHRLIDIGSSAQRQRQIVGQGGSLRDVVDHLQREFRRDEPEGCQR
jgi:carboxylate-amine ligase